MKNPRNVLILERVRSVRIDLVTRVKDLGFNGIPVSNIKEAEQTQQKE